MASISALCKHCEALIWQQEASASQCLRNERCMPGLAGLLKRFFLFRGAHHRDTCYHDWHADLDNPHAACRWAWPVALRLQLLLQVWCLPWWQYSVPGNLLVAANC